MKLLINDNVFKIENIENFDIIKKEKDKYILIKDNEILGTVQFNSNVNIVVQDGEIISDLTTEELLLKEIANLKLEIMQMKGGNI